MPFPVAGRSRNRPGSVFRPGRGRKPQIYRWNFDAICCSSSGITISGFDGHIAISGCRSMLRSLVDTSCELAVVENLRFAVKIVVISVILSEM